MYVGLRMTKKVITVAPGDTLALAAQRLSAHRIHRLPVVEGEKLVGILSDTDLRNVAAGDRTVDEAMTRDVITLSPWDTVEDALLILQKKRLAALPVVEGRRLVGILSKADVLAALIETLDIEGIGVRVEVLLPKTPESVRKLVGTIGVLGIEIRSLVLAPFRDGYSAFLRLSTIDVPEVKARLREAGFTVPELKDFLG